MSTTSEAVATRTPPFDRLRDFAALGKPRLSLLVIFTAATGVWLAPTQPSAVRTVVFLLATAGLVAAANTLNCWLEREIDGRMRRTRNRALPAGRLEPRAALLYGLLLGSLALLVLAAGTNPLTTLLGAVALVSYVALYTPLKRITPWAVFVGAVPGAIPPLMGWTMATNSLDAPGWFLFGVLFFWQLPHFMAISLYLEEDFRRGGIHVLPIAHGRLAARRWLVAATGALVVFTLTLVPRELRGVAYLTTAAVLGLAWLGLAVPGLRRSADPGWARRVFGYSLVYLPLLVAVLVLDAL